MKKPLCLLIISIFILFFLGQGYQVNAGVEEIERLYGDNRYETAVSISQEGWDASQKVVIARGDDYPDALAGVPLAYEKEGPLLLNPFGGLHDDTASEIDRLLTDGDTVYVLGDTAAISENVEDDLEDKGYEVERLEGVNRYETAVTITDELTDTTKLVERNQQAVK